MLQSQIHSDFLDGHIACTHTLRAWLVYTCINVCKMQLCVQRAFTSLQHAAHPVPTWHDALSSKVYSNSSVPVQACCCACNMVNEKQHFMPTACNIIAQDSSNVNYCSDGATYLHCMLHMIWMHGQRCLPHATRSACRQLGTICRLVHANVRSDGGILPANTVIAHRPYTCGS